MSKFKTPFKVRSLTKEDHDEMVKTFTEMLESWKYNKVGRDYTLEVNDEELIVEVIAESKNNK